MRLRGTTACMIGLLMFSFAFGRNADASSTTYSGTFAADNSVYQLPFTVTGNENFSFETTSYATGGFVPVLTLFSASGVPVGFDGADGMCNGSETPSSSTGMCDDAFLQETLSSGNYTLDLTEFPNVAIGDASDGFLFASDPTATGDVCGVSGGMFLESDLASCTQRTDAYSLTVNSTPAASPTPEPSTLLLFLPVGAVLGLASRRALS